MTTVARDEMARRLDAFVDAAFAFAVTLLVVGGGEPPATLDEMKAMLIKAPAYGAAFALIVMFWLGYRDLGRLWPHRDSLSTALSLAVVFVVLLYVFPLRLIMEGAVHALSGGLLAGDDLTRGIEDLRFFYIAYGAGCLMLSTLFALLYRHHLRRGDPSPEQAFSGRVWISNWTILSAVSALSIALAAVLRGQAAAWAPGFSYMAVPALIGITMAIHSRQPAAVDTGQVAP